MDLMMFPLDAVHLHSAIFIRRFHGQCKTKNCKCIIQYSDVFVRHRKHKSLYVGRAIPLPPLYAFMVCYRVNLNLPLSLFFLNTHGTTFEMKLDNCSGKGSALLS
jgi:hypothetical protein